ncbi:hypothetical protein ABZ695_32035 [Streptomyces sp. NPDC006976]|uniref:hypothetical protein n=1 Tax=Streptomyces sp. NPDC006976 TaxID=3154311 RepID=UPI0034114949
MALNAFNGRGTVNAIFGHLLSASCSNRNFEDANGFEQLNDIPPPDSAATASAEFDTFGEGVPPHEGATARPVQNDRATRDGPANPQGNSL